MRVILMRLVISSIILVLLVIGITVTAADGLFEYNTVKTLTVYAPAVSSSGEGVLSKMTLAIAYPGNGRVFFSALPYTEVETQGATRIAAYISTLIANADFSSLDYFILVESTTPLIGGPSAGGLITVGLTALLLDITISSNVTMTGMINPDGSVGFVGGLKEKLDAAKTYGFTTFLIPAGQRIYSYPVYEEIRRGPFVFRTVRYESVDLVEYGRQIGVNVVEVMDVGEAFYYFTGINLSRPKIAMEIKDIYFDKLNKISAVLIEKITKLLVDSTSIARQLPSSYYRSIYLQSLYNLNNTMDRLVKLINSYPIYAVYNLLNVYQSALQYYWSLSIGTKLSTFEDLAYKLNESIIEAYGELQSDQCNLANSLIQSMLYISWLYYTNFMNESDTSTALNYASTALKYVELSRLMNELNEDSSALDCRDVKFMELYSHALAVYTYTLSLVEESGQTFSQLGELNNYISTIQYMYENRNVGVYISAAFIIMYSTKSIHELVGSLYNIVSRGEQLLNLYWFNNSDPVILFYLELFRESAQLSDASTAVISMLTAISILQVLRVAERDRVHPLYTSPRETSQGTNTTMNQPASNASITSTTSVTNSTTNGTFTTSPDVSIRTLDLVILILLIVSLFIIILRFKWSH